MSDDWKPIKETDFYDPHAAEKDATVRIAASELERLKAERDALKAEVERLAHGHYKDDHRYHPLKNENDKLRAEVGRLKVLNAELKSGAICHICYDTMDEESKTMEQLRAENERLKGEAVEMLGVACHEHVTRTFSQANKRYLQEQLTKEREISAMLREALRLDREYYEAKPHKCLEILNRADEALKREAEMRGEK